MTRRGFVALLGGLAALLPGRRLWREALKVPSESDESGETRAATCIWCGGPHAHDLECPDNWEDGHLPAPGDTVVFPDYVKTIGHA